MYNLVFYLYVYVSQANEHPLVLLWQKYPVLRSYLENCYRMRDWRDQTLQSKVLLVGTENYDGRNEHYKAYHVTAYTDDDASPDVLQHKWTQELAKYSYIWIPRTLILLLPIHPMYLHNTTGADTNWIIGSVKLYMYITELSWVIPSTFAATALTSSL